MSHTATHRRRHRVAAVAAVASIGLFSTACGSESTAETATADSSSDAAAADSSSADSSADNSTAAAAPSFGLVSPGEAALLTADDGVEVIDVRTPEEFADGHIEGAAMIDFYSESFAAQIADLDPNATYLVYCRSGNRSGQTLALMDELGFEQVYDLDGGVLAWDAQGGPLVR
jgi:rhodanese-related sulfurtransferase